MLKERQVSLKRELKIGDLVVCWCDSPTWYQGRPGIVVDIERFGPAWVNFGNETLGLAKCSLKVFSESKV